MCKLLSSDVNDDTDFFILKDTKVKLPADSIVTFHECLSLVGILDMFFSVLCLSDYKTRHWIVFYFAHEDVDSK